MVSRSQIACFAAATGANYAYDRFRTDLEIEEKGSRIDLVTKIDRETQERTIATIHEEFPDDTIVAEEADKRKTVPDEGYAWIIDPIDGTLNYTRGMREWITSVALVDNGRPVASVNAAPALGDTYTMVQKTIHRDGDVMSVSETSDPSAFLVASTLRLHREESENIGILAERIINELGELRRTGSAQLTLSMVADGALDASIGLNEAPRPWDTVAGVHHVRQAGGTVTDIYGRKWRSGCSGLVASNGELHDEVLTVAQQAAKRTQ